MGIRYSFQFFPFKGPVFPFFMIIMSASRVAKKNGFNSGEYDILVKENNESVKEIDLSGNEELINIW